MQARTSKDMRPDGPSEKEIVQDVLSRYQNISSKFLAWCGILGILFLLAVVVVITRLANGFEDRAAWGYYSATLMFLAFAFMSTPAISAGLRFIKGHWRRPMTRIPELYGLTGMLGLLMLFPAIAALPDIEGRTTIWFEWPTFAPMGWDAVGVLALALTGIVMLWILAIPDLAKVRDQFPQTGRQKFIRFLALGWVGSIRQWRIHRLGSLTLGGMYLLLFPLVMTLLGSELSAGLLPGYKDAIQPAYLIIVSMQAGLALTIITMYILRSAGGYERYIGVDQFWALSKPLLAISLLWFYFWWASFITFWYGRQPSEIGIIRFIMFESYRFPFLMTFFLNFIIPLVALIWNPVRRSTLGPTLVSAGILVGALFNSIRLVVSAYSVPDPTLHVLTPLPKGQMPELFDLVIIVGGISGAMLLFLLASKIIPPFSLWEMGEGTRLSKVRRFLNREYRVISKQN